MSDAGRPPRPARTWPDRFTPDPALIARLNTEWEISAFTTTPTLKERLARPFRRLFSEFLNRQERFNATVVQLLNDQDRARAVSADREETLRAMVDDVFHRSELLFDRVEQLTARLGELAAHVHVRFNEVTGSIDHLGEAIGDIQRFPESFAARERRLRDDVAALAGEHAEVRTGLAVIQQQATQLARQVASGASGASKASGADGVEDRPARPAPPASDSPHALSHKYVGFEDAFRGSPEAIQEGLRQYVPLFVGASDVLDVGCGRGEFLSLLAGSGVSGRGIDINESMVDVCREKGLDATAADALGYLRGLPDASLGGLFAGQVVEHLEPAYLTHLLEAAFDKLRPGAPIVLETINPACWFAFFESYIRDITHIRPLHPETLTFLLVASGFQRAEVRYSAPYPDHQKLQPIAAAGGLADAAETLNANVEKINRLLFTYLDYAAIARRP